MPEGFRDSFLRGVVWLGLAVFFMTELFSAFHLLRTVPLMFGWAGIAFLVLLRSPKTPRRFHIPMTKDPVVLLCLFGTVTILALTALTAICSPPNSADAMAYHLPRVMYWAEQQSIRFFPTPYFAQIMLQPLAEYFALHTVLLSGRDHFVNLVQWFASVACVTGVSAIAGKFGASLRGQALAALFCATLPSGILASSGAKNDYVLAMWLVAAVCFALRFSSTLRMADALLFGAALGLAFLTKATAYLFAPCVIAAVLLSSPNRLTRRLWTGTLAALACAVSINAPHYIRNYQFSGSVMGFDSAQGNGVYRWRNDNLGWKPTVSNILRNTSEQLGARSDGWNQRVYRAVLGIHRTLGIDIGDPATTWPTTTFAAPKNANHEADAPNRWHLGIFLLITCLLAWRALRGTDRERALYALSLLCAFIGFCAYLKWQPFLSRLFLPLFVLCAPLAALMGSARRAFTVIQIGICLVLLDGARHPLLDNWVRPLRGPGSVLHTPRDEQYFAYMSQWHNRPTYLKAVEALSHLPCNTIGIDIADMQLEYPAQALLREKNPRVQFLHTGVQNASSRYQQPVAAPACAVVCLDCAGDALRRSLYSRFRKAAEIDQFVIFSEE